MGVVTNVTPRYFSAFVLVLCVWTLQWGQIQSATVDSAEYEETPRCEYSLALPIDNTQNYTSDQVWRANGTTWFCPCDIRPCLWMCCPKGMVYNVNGTCVDSGWFPRTVEMTGEDQMLQNVFLDKFYLRYEEICPGNRLTLEPEEIPEDNFTLFTNLTLDTFEGFIEPREYCLGFGENKTKRVTMCYYKNELPPTKVAHVMYATCMMFSLPFLLATFCVYAILPRLRNVHGRIVMCNVGLLFLAYLSLTVVNLAGSSLTNYPNVCKPLAFIIYFAFLASFFWLNVMCLDIWWTFSGFRPMRGSVKEREHKKFIIYSLYCWGSPLIMLIICMVMDLHPDIPDSYIKPGFGELKCWFKSNLGNFIYFSGPIAILIICNIILFILTAVKIRQVKRGTKILKKQDSRRHNEEEENNTQRFNLYFKLFLVMGVNWIMEIVSFAAGGPDEYWYITDIANTLQGVLIFIIFVWKDRIRKLLVERFCPSRAANTNSLANSSSTRTTGIRHNGSVMSSHRPSFKNKDDYQMKTLTSPSARSDDSDVA